MNKIKLLIFLLLVTGILPHLFYLMSTIKNSVYRLEYLLSDRKASLNIKNHAIFQFIKEVLPENSLSLILRQNDFFWYSHKKLLRDVDPSMIDFFHLKNKQEAYNYLVQREVNYILIPNYFVPTFFNSQLYAVVADPSLCKLILDIEGAQLYALQKDRFRALIFNKKIDRKNFKINIKNWFPVPFFKAANFGLRIESDSIYRISNKTDDLNFVSEKDSIPINKNKIYKIEGNVLSDGLFSVYLLEYSHGLYKTARLLWQCVGNGELRRIEKLFVPSDGANSMLILTIFRGGKINSLVSFKIKEEMDYYAHNSGIADTLWMSASEYPRKNLNGFKGGELKEGELEYSTFLGSPENSPSHYVEQHCNMNGNFCIHKPSILEISVPIYCKGISDWRLRLFYEGNKYKDVSLGKYYLNNEYSVLKLTVPIDFYIQEHDPMKPLEYRLIVSMEPIGFFKRLIFYVKNFINSDLWQWKMPDSQGWFLYVSKPTFVKT